MTYRPRRSVLFMPASNLRALEKAKTLKADAIVFDLEDSVGPDDKDLARRQACDAVASGEYGLRELIIRVNDYHSDCGQQDILAAVRAGADAILVPKVDEASDIVNLSQVLSDEGATADMKLWVMMETPKAIINAAEMAQISRDEGCRLSCFVMGTNDLAKATGAAMTTDRWSMMSWLQGCVIAARAYDLNILDSVYNNFSDQEGFRQECEQGLAMGMDGKTLIHPSQIDASNEVFAPSDDEVLWSRKVLAAFELPENIGKGVISVEGKMVERLHGEMAQRVVDMADVIENMSKQ